MKRYEILEEIDVKSRIHGEVKGYFVFDNLFKTYLFRFYKVGSEQPIMFISGDTIKARAKLLFDMTAERI